MSPYPLALQSHGESATTTSRFESKYVIDPLMLPALRQFLLSVAREDPFGSSLPDHRYPICSLYLDTDDLRFYRQYLQGERRRFKLRVRTYSDDPGAPAFLEVKARIDRVVTKRRVALGREEACDVIRGRRRVVNRQWDCRGAADFDYFVDQMHRTSSRPLVKVRYMREAFMARGHEPVRVTFDTAIQYQATLGPNLSHKGGTWLPTPVGGVILEVKFTGRFPSWVEHMVRGFGLMQVKCCKFALSVGQILARGGTALGGRAFKWLPAAG